MSYIYFYNKKHPYWGVPGYDLKSELEGDDFSIGYNFGTTFRLMESQDYGRLALGVVYRSQIKHNIKGDFDINGRVPHPKYGDSLFCYGRQYSQRRECEADVAAVPDGRPQLGLSE